MARVATPRDSIYYHKHVARDIGWAKIGGGAVAELGGATTYIYWSQRRISNFCEDNGIHLQRTTKKFTSPSFSGIAPQVELNFNSPMLRSHVADVVERSLGLLAVEDLSFPGSIRYAKGAGTVVFGEFVSWEHGGPVKDDMAVMFTSQGDVAVCLFGGMDNFSDYVREAGPGRKDGWTSSAAPEIRRFLQLQCARGVEPWTREELAEEALKVANGQGRRSGQTDTFAAWRRGFTYGDVQDVAEWCAEIYYDVRLEDTHFDRFFDDYKRVLIGAPYWIRSPKPESVRLYAHHRGEELEGTDIRRRDGIHEANFIRRLLDRRRSNSS